MKNITIKVLFSLLMLTASLAVSAQCDDGGNQNGGHGTGGERGKGGSILDDITNFLEWFIRGVHSADPNDILGPEGYEVPKWVSINDRLEYRIRFENNPQFATAPAQNVYVNLPVHPNININSVRLGSFGFGKYTFPVPENTSYYTTRLDMRDSLGLFVDLTAGIDITKHEVFWIFKSIDPRTGQAPTDAMAGFLPVNDTAITRFNDSIPKPGEGFVNFLVTSKRGLQTGDTVAGKAVIVFDTNEEIPTNTWTNTIDAVAPASRINLATVQSDTITLHWAGQDDARGTGVREYALYVSENGGVFTLFRNRIRGTSATFTGNPGNSYCFFTLASDQVGNLEGLKTTGDLCARLESGSALPVNWLYFRGNRKEPDVVLNWATATESNAKEFVIERSLNGSVYTTIGKLPAAGNSTQVSRYEYIDRNALELSTKKLYYRLRQVDLDNRHYNSSTVVIPVSKDQLEPEIKVYPNPFSQAITVLINSDSEFGAKDRVGLYTTDGKLLHQRSLMGVQRGAPFTLNNLPQLANGVYILKTEINGKTTTVKVIKQ
ncbi:MAG: T9SS type A sorting domain-containing protein [Niastella sp.]|nr:T9SS type A sorting domain-containing protein [Niastella sp.]